MTRSYISTVKNLFILIQITDDFDLMIKENLRRELRKKKKWAEARREEEEDFNLSPWFA